MLFRSTGGMGAYAPAPVVTDALRERIAGEVLRPTVAGMAADGVPFRGVLYAGLMIVDGEPLVLEYNVRFGDPECQPLLALLDEDLLPLLRDAAAGRLEARDLAWRDGAALCVVLASEGYPGSYRKGLEIEGLDALAGRDDVVVFHAGTRRESGRLVTSGGRVLGVTGRGAGLDAAARAAYDAARHVRFDGARMRRDIGHRAL